MKLIPLMNGWDFVSDADSFEIYRENARKVNLPHDFMMEKTGMPKGSAAIKADSMMAVMEHIGSNWSTRVRLC